MGLAVRDRDAWWWAALACHVVLPVLTLATLVSLWQLGAAPWQLSMTVGAAFALHLGLALVGRHPWTGYGTTAAAMLALVVTPTPGWSPTIVPSMVCFPLALWWLAARRPRRESVAALAIATAGIAITEVVAWSRSPTDGPDWTRPAEGILLLAVTAGGWGLAFRSGQRLLARQRADAERLAAAVAAERASIRRDLHDVIAHTVTVMVARTEAAAVTTSDQGTRRELVDIAETGRDAHRGLRAMLTTLDTEDTEDTDRQRAPLSLDALGDLVTASSSPLHTVTLAEQGTRRPLSLSAEIAVVRTVQEGVTNALRHLAPPVTVMVSLTWSVAEVVVEVRDDGGTGQRGGSAHGTGLLGITERVHAADGTMTIERPATGSGWALTARIPTKNASGPDPTAEARR